MIYLSPWSIWMLKKDNLGWYKGYVLWQRWFSFNPHTTVGDYCHRVLEDWAKGKGTKHKHHNDMLIAFEKAGHDTVVDWVDFPMKFLIWLESFESLNYPTPVVAEQEIKKTLKNYWWYWVKSKIDGIRSDHWADYKFVSKLTPIDDSFAKYWEQMEFYQYVVWLTILQKLNWRVIECCNEEKATRVFDFPWNDWIIEKNEDIIRKSIIKAERLKTLTIENVL